MNKSNELAINSLLSKAKLIVAKDGVTRTSLVQVLEIVGKLATIPGQWTVANYPDPAPDERQARYLIRSEEDDSFTLYLNVMRSGNRIPPHNHTTWACIAAVEGTEQNTIYERTDGGVGAGPATLRIVEKIEVKPGSGISLLADDIHSVDVENEKPTRHLHFYGKALESLTERLMFDLTEGQARPMKMLVTTKR